MPKEATKEATKDANNPEDVTIVVTGFRNSVMEQLNNKRFSESISDSIFAEDIGKMPDENIAEAMQRITGVGISREDGEGRGVTVRGIGPDQNQITLNGQTLTSDGEGTGVDLSSMSADMLRSIEVIKTPSASDEEGSLGATIKLKTHRPLDVKKKIGRASLQYKQNDHSEKSDLAVKGSFINKYKDDTVGIAVSAFYDQKSTRNDSFLTATWKVSPNPDMDGNLVDVYWPQRVSATLKEKERVRIGAALTLEFELDDVTTFWVDYAYNKLTDENYNTGVQVQLAHVGNNLLDEATNSPIFSSYLKAKGASVTTLTDLESDTHVLGLNFEHDFENWSLGANLGASSTEKVTLDGRSLIYRPTNAGTPISINWVNENGQFQDIPNVLIHTDSGQFDQTTTFLSQVRDPDVSVKDEIHNFALNLERDMDIGIINHIDIGVKYTKRSKDNLALDGLVGWNGIRGDFGIDNVYLSEYDSSPFPYDNFLGGLTDNSIAGWTIPNVDLIHQTFLPNGYTGGIDPIRTYTIETKTAAGYIKFDFAAFDDALSGNFGVRLVETQSTSIGSEGIRFPVAYKDENVVQAVSALNTYTNSLPSFNARYTLNEEMLLRFSVGKVMARPKITDLRPGVDYALTNSANRRATGGNPELKPTTATQVDLSWEWYFAETGLLSVAAFYKEINSIVYNKGFIISIPCPEGLTVCDDVYDGGPIDDIVGKYAQNGEGGELKGVELSYQQDLTFLPGFLSNLGTVINYTYTDSEGRYSDANEDTAEGTECTAETTSNCYNGLPFIDTSRDTFNSTVYWQKDGNTVRLAYNYRSARLLNPVDTISAIWADARQSLDLSAVYKINKDLSLTFAATNLTDEYNRSYITRMLPSGGLEGNEGNGLSSDARTWRTKNLAYIGKTYRLGVNYKF
jgi:iron complex outermembrane receptor protein